METAELCLKCNNKDVRLKKRLLYLLYVQYVCISDEKSTFSSFSWGNGITIHHCYFYNNLNSHLHSWGVTCLNLKTTDVLDFNSTSDHFPVRSIVLEITLMPYLKYTKSWFNVFKNHINKGELSFFFLFFCMSKLHTVCIFRKTRAGQPPGRRTRNMNVSLTGHSDFQWLFVQFVSKWACVGLATCPWSTPHFTLTTR